jgi:anaerobic selenocysteine-containing dehydrogenase
MIAAELAYRLGADLGITSVDDVWAELADVSALHAEVTVARLAAEADGVVLGRSEPAVASDEATGDRTAEGAEAAAHDEVVEASVAAAAADEVTERQDLQAEAVEAQAEQEAEAAADEADADAEAEAPAPAAPTAPVAVRFQAGRYDAPALDAYSLRLVTRRRLYDLGTQVQAAPSLAGLAAGPSVAASAADLDRLGVADGDQVRLSSSRGSLVVQVRLDPGVPAGVVAMALNQGDPDPGVLIDATAAVTEVRVETLS